MNETLIWNAASIIISGITSFCIAKWVRARSKLSISLEPILTMNLNGVGKDFGIPDRDLGVFKLTIKTGFVMGVTVGDLYEGYKPAIKMDGFKIKKVITINNNSARFYIPIARTANDTKLILNMNWIRRNTRAEFHVVGSLTRGISATDVKAKLYPGLMKDVDVRPNGLIAPKFDEHNFRPEGSCAKVEIHA